MPSSRAEAPQCAGEIKGEAGNGKPAYHPILIQRRSVVAQVEKWVVPPSPRHHPHHRVPPSQEFRIRESLP